MTAKRIKRESLWYCTMCQVSGATPTREGAREGMILHFMSSAHQDTSDKLETLDLHRRKRRNAARKAAATRKRRRAA